MVGRGELTIQQNAEMIHSCWQLYVIIMHCIRRHISHGRSIQCTRIHVRTVEAFFCVLALGPALEVYSDTFSTAGFLCFPRHSVEQPKYGFKIKVNLHLMHNLQEKNLINAINFIVSDGELAHRTSCTVDRLPFTQNVSFLNLKACWRGVILTAGLLRYTVIASIAAHGMPALHTVCYSGKQVGRHQITAETHLKLNPSCRKWLQATEWRP